MVKVLFLVLFAVAQVAAQCMTCIMQRDSLSVPEKPDTCRIVVSIKERNDVFVWQPTVDTVRAIWKGQDGVWLRKGNIYRYPMSQYTIQIVEILKP